MTTSSQDDRDGQAKIFISNLEKDAANTTLIEGGQDTNKGVARDASKDKALDASYEQSPDLNSLSTLQQQNNKDASTPLLKTPQKSINSITKKESSNI